LSGIKKTISAPLTEETIKDLHAGDQALLSGKVYVARDAAHKKFVELLQKGRGLPFTPQGQVLFYAGPTPPQPGETIGVVGPTTAGRMDIYTTTLLKAGLKGMIGKGRRSPEVAKALQEYKAVYFVATGGVAALLKDRIKKARIIAFKELGPEAVQELIVEDFPVIVANDIYGEDIFQKFK
jgi:fumarate hydratase subunit beta